MLDQLDDPEKPDSPRIPQGRILGLQIADASSHHLFHLPGVLQRPVSPIDLQSAEVPESINLPSLPKLLVCGGEYLGQLGLLGRFQRLRLIVLEDPHDLLSGH